MRRLGFAMLLTAAVAGCSGGAKTDPSLPQSPGVRAASWPRSAGKIKHVVFIVQENRTFDNIFGGPSPLPGADAAPSGRLSDGTSRPLDSVHLENDAGYGDPNNYHYQWLQACNAPAGAGPPFKVGAPSPCKMNGFDRNAKQQKGYPGPPGANYDDSLGYIYSYVRRDETVPYWFIAQRYAVGDHFFMGHNSESFTAHQYIFSSQSNDVVDSPVFPPSTSCSAYYDFCAYTPWGCDSPSGTQTYSLSSATGAWNGGPPAYPNGPPPCFGAPGSKPYLSMANLAQQHGVSWRMYAYSMCSGIVALDVNYSIRNSAAWPDRDDMSKCHDHYGLDTPLTADNENFRAPQYTFLTDEKTGGKPLAAVTWILPGAYTSDHPGVPGGYCGPEWVASVINAIGANKADWDSTAIFVLWDDWGGFYDHVPPYTVRDQAGPGFRVPLLVVSPYARQGVIHTNTEFATLNKFVEDTFGLGSLGVTDASPYLNNLDEFFDFDQAPKAFTQVPNPDYHGCRYLMNATPSKNETAHSRWLRIVGNDPD